MDGEQEISEDNVFPIDLVPVHVDAVVRGDPALEGGIVRFAQPGSFERIGSETDDIGDWDRLAPGQSVVIVAKNVDPSPGVGDGESIWVTPYGGQGIFDVGDTGRLMRNSCPQRVQAGRRA